MGIVSPFKTSHTFDQHGRTGKNHPEMISAGLTNTWMAQAWIKAERSTAAIVITRRIFLSFCRSFICSSIVFKLLVFPILSRPPATLFVFLTDTRRAALPPQKAALSHESKNRHTIKYCWHPHTKQKPVRHSFVLLTNVTIASFHSFVNLFVHFSKYLLFF